MKLYKFFISVGLSLVAISLIVALVYRTPVETSPKPSDDVLGYVPEFNLTNAMGNNVSNSDMQSCWVANFIFTRCAGLCPMMTSRMKKIKSLLPQGVQFVSISVDPKDKPKVLREYAKRQKANWTFLTGNKGEVRELCQEGFNLPLSKTPDKNGQITHSKNIVLVDKQGGIRGYYDGMDPKAVDSLVAKANSLNCY